MSERVLEINGLNCGYGSVQILYDIDLYVDKGEFVTIIGPNGCGKSTLLRAIAGFESVMVGEILMAGQLVSSAAFTQVPELRQISMVFQDLALFPHLTIEQNIGFGCERSELDARRVMEAAKIAQLHDVIEDLPAKYQTMIGENGVLLSGGQRQRLGIARALYRESSLIVFDEATSALDADTEKRVMSGIGELSEAKTLIMIAHRISTLSNCNKIVKIHNGNLEVIDNLRDISR